MQFLLVRRIVIGCVITFVIIGGVMTEFGSLATFAGIITAGIAVALQSVILSGVAYFFFIGRYGVRVGDRLTISGITGDVIDLGVFRLYLMELGGTGHDLNPTGRIVVFSNSVLFQPSAFFKQMPGADYGWHEVALTLAPDSDHALAERRLMGAVEAVFAGYRRGDRAAVRGDQRFTAPADWPRPSPRAGCAWWTRGWSTSIRYPVEIRRAPEIDDRDDPQTAGRDPGGAAFEAGGVGDAQDPGGGRESPGLANCRRANPR